MAARRKIKNLLKAGYDRKYIHAKLKKDGVITMSYSTFCAQFQKHGDGLAPASKKQIKTNPVNPPPKPKGGPTSQAWPSKADEPFSVDKSRTLADLA
jgi:hypothetical protein